MRIVAVKRKIVTATEARTVEDITLQISRQKRSPPRAGRRQRGLVVYSPVKLEMSIGVPVSASS